MDEKKLTFEAYTLILKHSIWDGEHEHELEEPIVVRFMFDTALGSPAYKINEMIDRMKHEILLRCAR